MVAPLFSFSAAEVLPSDLSLDFGGFSSTEIVVTPTTEKGREFMRSVFGAGVTSVNIRKSDGERFAAFAQERGVVAG